MTKSRRKISLGDMKIGEVFHKSLELGYYIYGLRDPRDGVIAYVGRTRTLQYRLDTHCREAVDCRSFKDIWITSLFNAGLSPEMVILDIVAAEEFSDAEARWIAKCRGENPNLLNDRKRRIASAPKRSINAKNHIRRYLRKQGISQQALADKLGVHYSTVCYWASGKRKMPLRMVRLLTLEDEVAN